MKKYFSIFIVIFLIAAALGGCSRSNASSDQKQFKAFIKSVKEEALSKGISKETIDKYLDPLKLPKPLKKMPEVREQAHQAQAILTFQEYLDRLVPEYKKIRAKKEYDKHKILLLAVYVRYHVQPRFIVALWGIESDFGDYMGDFPLVGSLAILAFHHHRSEFYRNELIDALKILDQGPIIPEMLLSAFDGGMGQPQFEPTAYLSYAVDFDNNGFKNIWTSYADTFASIANYLRLNGWDGSQSWGIEVKIPKHFPLNLSGVHVKKNIAFWRKIGVTQLDGKRLRYIRGKASIILPAGLTGPAYLVYPNFDVLLRWNDTTFEGLSVGLLSDSVLPLSN